MANVISLYVLLGLIMLGGAGVCLALPRGGRTVQAIGALLAGLAGAVLMVVLGTHARDHLPNVFFYIFAAVGVGAALRVITHPRPVYAALYFIMTVIASGGLFLLLSAEFMAFAIIIVYAGAILITYLFVIMLATQAPEEGETEMLASYDTSAREPLGATVVGFLLLGVLSAMLFQGVGELPRPADRSASVLLGSMPRKVERVLADAGVLKEGEAIGAVDGAGGTIEIKGPDGSRTLTKDQWPADLRVTNIEGVGFDLLREHPGTIEIAGVILLMAMLGAVVLSRKQVQLDDEAKLRQAHRLASGLSREGGEA